MNSAGKGFAQADEANFRESTKIRLANKDGGGYGGVEEEVGGLIGAYGGRGG